MRPPTDMIGARIMMFRAITRTICTCWTSLVLRVISVGAPNEFVSCCEKPMTLRKIALRMSRPIDIEVSEPK